MRGHDEVHPQFDGVGHEHSWTIRWTPWRNKSPSPHQIHGPARGQTGPRRHTRIAATRRPLPLSRVTRCERVAMPPSPADFVLVFPSLIDERSGNERAGYSLHVDDNLSSRVSLLQIADRLRNVAQSVTPVDDRCDLASLHQLAHEGQILFAQPRQKHVKVLAHKP
jgi:hypothetical protein